MDRRLAERLADDDPMIRVDAAFELAQQGTNAGKQVLLDALTDPDWEVRQRAASRLGRIGSASAAEPLAKLLEDPISPVRNAAIVALRQIGRPYVVPTLIRALADEDEDIREDAGVALSLLLGREAVDQLGDELDEDDVEEMVSWWDDNAARFDDGSVYANGEPADIGRLVAKFTHAPPEIREIVSNDLCDQTGVQFEGSHEEQASAWQRWWQANSTSLPPGRRYFHGRDTAAFWDTDDQG